MEASIIITPKRSKSPYYLLYFLLSTLSRLLSCPACPYYRPSSLIPRPSFPPPSPRRALQIAPFYAKQTQSPIPQNQRNLLFHKELHQYSAPAHPKKQTQTNPNLPLPRFSLHASRDTTSDIRNTTSEIHGVQRTAFRINWQTFGFRKSSVEWPILK